MTERMRPLKIDGRELHQIALPWHWGFTGEVKGDSTNDLFGIALYPTVLILESMVGTCEGRRGRPPRRPSTVGCWPT